MSWLKLEDTFHDHPKFKRLGRALGIHPMQARGHMAALWSWCLRYAPDGVLDQFETEDIEDAMGWDGKRGALVFAAVDVRLIDETETGLTVHEWMERAEGLKNAQRVQRHRNKKRSVMNSNVTEPLLKRSCNGGEERRGEEKRGEEKETHRAKPKNPSDLTHAEIEQAGYDPNGQLVMDGWVAIERLMPIAEAELTRAIDGMKAKGKRSWVYCARIIESMRSEASRPATTGGPTWASPRRKSRSELMDEAEAELIRDVLENGLGDERQRD